MPKELEENRLKKIKNYVTKIADTIKTLEDNLKESNQQDHEALLSQQVEKIKYQGLSNLLEEAQKENKELLNILQQRISEHDLSRPESLADLSSSYSTMSIVHLQYKYEELLSNHKGLLKLLDVKSKEFKELHEENLKLKQEQNQLEEKLRQTENKARQFKKKVIDMRERKNAKIRRLETEKRTLQMAHNQVVDLLHKQCMEKDRLLSAEIKKCEESERALLLQEIKKNNLLTYENFHLNQEIDLLKSMFREDTSNE